MSVCLLSAIHVVQEVNDMTEVKHDVSAFPTENLIHLESISLETVILPL